jgi:hypothetical protein
VFTTDGDTTHTSRWRKASYCGEGGCVEVALAPEVVGLRDSKRADSPVLSFDRDEWVAFVAGVKNGEFDLL